MKSAEQPWLAAHLYYAEPWDDFLPNIVFPLVQQVQADVSGYFFIRYWEQGPHIRLRFRAEPDVLESRVRPQLEQWFGDHFQQYPSERPVPEPLPAGPAWYPNNSVQYICYEPETERYGGPDALRVAEDQFQHSSQAVLRAMQASEQWDYDRALGVAIQMHLGFAHRLGMDREEAYAFFSQVFKHWLPRAYYRPDLSAEALTTLHEQVMRSFAQSYERHRPVLVPFVDQVWDSLSSGESFAQDWFQQWVDSMRVIHRRLITCQQQGLLKNPYRDSIKPQLTFSEAQQSRWAIYESYVHMTNNRLGIFNRDEGFLGFLMRESIKSLTGDTLAASQ